MRDASIFDLHSLSPTFTSYSVIRAAHVEFDEITNPPEIRGDSDDFEYATLDFFPLSEKDEATSGSAEVINIDEAGDAGEMVKDDLDENIDLGESDGESIAPGSHDPLVEIFENLKINQQFEQAAPAPPPQPTSASSRSSRNI